MSIDLDAYFRRIGFDGDATATLATLQQLQRLHTQSIAFENLASLCGQPVPLDHEALQAKLVRGGRGGYCFEHNTLFWAVLRQLGYEVEGLAARVLWQAPAGRAAPRGHMLLHLHVDGHACIADVGFGGMTMTAPLQLAADTQQTTPHEPFRLRQADGLYTLEAGLPGGWQPLYCFDLQRQQAMDYEVFNWYISTWPQSQFVNHLMAARPQVGGRHALRDNVYTFRPLGGDARSRVLGSVRELRETLAGPFGLTLPADAAVDARLQWLLDNAAAAPALTPISAPTSGPTPAPAR